jgi:small subunit ribosomal protein S17
MAEAGRSVKDREEATGKKGEEDAAEAEPVVPKKIKVAKEIDKVQAKRKLKPISVVRKKKVAKKVERPPRNIGLEVTPPADSCNDPTCPFHGTLSVRGQIIDGFIISIRMDKSVVVRKEHLRYLPKYERYEKRSNHYTAHNPACIDAQEGEKVKIAECRPLSKTKSFVVVERLGTRTS